MPQPMNDIRLPEAENKPEEFTVVDRYEPDPESVRPPFAQRLKRHLKLHKKWLLPIAALAIVAAIFAVPLTRYDLSALVLRKDFSFKVVDATTGLPVSGATVQAGKLSAQTDAGGQATLSLPVGERTINVSKSYYRAGTFDSLIPILRQRNVPVFSMQATGRQVKITVRNLISKNVLPGAGIEVAGISATTDKNGSALVVLPPGIAKQSAALSLDGFVDSKSTVSVSDKKIETNNLFMTPVGKVYFLAEQAGKLDVMKSNLDGSSSEVVVAGTGNEDPAKTYLSHSTDWKYLALISKRGNASKLYVINTADDQLLTMDEGDGYGTFGWSGDNFIYDTVQSRVFAGKYEQVTLKSYDAQTGRLTSLDQTSTQMINASSFLQSSISNVYLLDGNVVYTKFWGNFGYSSTNDLTGKTEYFYSVKPDGSNRKTLMSAKATDYQWAIGKLYEPGKLHYQLGGSDSSGKRKAYVYYDYSSGQLSRDKNLTESQFNEISPYYYPSPSADKYAWSTSQNGKEQVFVSSAQSFSPQSVNGLAGFDAAGWFGDEYLLVTENNTLYIVSNGGGTPVKIAAYQPGGVY